VLQTVYLPLILRGNHPSELTITGGTHVKASPSFHFLNTTWRGYLELMELAARLELKRAGFYPRGGGVVRVELEPCSAVRPLQLSVPEEPPELHVTGVAGVAGLPEDIAERMIARAVTRFKKQRLPCELSVEVWPGGPGAGLALVLHGPPVPTLFYGLGERGKRAERVADEAVDELLAHVAAAPAAVDPHSADQILLPLALADGTSEYPVSRVTQHLLTNIEVIKRFVPREVVCEGAEGEVGRIEIH
jgi:RNA 3'-terminal phosphate cyclase (ATP)